MEIATEAKTLSINSDLTEITLFEGIRRLRKIDNILLVCSLMDYPHAKELLKAHPELRLRVIGVPSLPKNDAYAWMLIDLNDLQAIYSAGE